MKSSSLYLLVCAVFWLCAQFSPFDVGGRQLGFDRSGVFVHGYYLFLALMGVLFRSCFESVLLLAVVGGALCGLLAGVFSYLIVVIDNFWSLGSGVDKFWSELPISLLYVSTIFLTPLWGALASSIVFFWQRRKKKI